MIGAIIGDVIGSSYEFDNVKRKDFDSYTNFTQPTDDSIMTLAVAETLMNSFPIDYSNQGLEKIKEQLVINMVKWHKEYPHVSYGYNFSEWLDSKERKPYNSFGNGAGMRVSPVGWIANNEEEVKLLSKAVTEITHNHPEGIKGAEAIAMCVYLAIIGKDKEYIKNYVINNYYPRLKDLNYDELVDNYYFDVTCQGSVPEAIYCFLISKDFEDCLRTSISIGGDSDTIACMACAIGEAFYKKIPSNIERNVIGYLNFDMISIIQHFEELAK